MIFLLANCGPFSALFVVIPPLGDFLASHLIRYATDENVIKSRALFILSKLGPNLSEMKVTTFARVKKVIWDQLLASKAEIVKGKLYFLLRVKT